MNQIDIFRNMSGHLMNLQILLQSQTLVGKILLSNSAVTCGGFKGSSRKTLAVTCAMT